MICILKNLSRSCCFSIQIISTLVCIIYIVLHVVEFLFVFLFVLFCICVLCVFKYCACYFSYKVCDEEMRRLENNFFHSKEMLVLLCESVYFMIIMYQVSFFTLLKYFNIFIVISGIYFDKQPVHL